MHAELTTLSCIVVLWLQHLLAQSIARMRAPVHGCCNGTTGPPCNQLAKAEGSRQSHCRPLQAHGARVHKAGRESEHGWQAVEPCGGRQGELTGSGTLHDGDHVDWRSAQLWFHTQDALGLDLFTMSGCGMQQLYWGHRHRLSAASPVSVKTFRSPHSHSGGNLQVDADKHREIGNRFDVKGFPTILYFARGKPVESHTPCVSLELSLGCFCTLAARFSQPEPAVHSMYQKR